MVNLGLFFLKKSRQTIGMQKLNVLFFIFLSSCTIYRSPERSDFESEYQQLKVQNLTVQSCSKKSVAQFASASKMVYIAPENYLIWEHIIDHASVYESNNFKGDYCIYEYTE